jgi:type VII secretion-associated serine protease mycosin
MRLAHGYRAGLASLLTISLLGSVTPAYAAVPDTHWWLTQWSIEQVWQQTRGQGVRVAIIDTGIDTSHPDLAGTVLAGADFSGVGSSDGQTPVGDAGFHGSLVASLIAGQGERTGGVWGIAPEVDLLSASIGVGIEAADTDTQIAQAVRWAVDEGAQVINISLSRNSDRWPKSWDDAFLYAFENDVLIVAASGNSEDGRPGLTAPATVPGVLAVAGVDRNGLSAAGATAEGVAVALVAPAVNLLGSYPGPEVREWSGSSAAAPLVAGLAALIRAEYPDLSAASVIDRLLATATDAGDVGFDTSYGWGIPNPMQALAVDRPAQTVNPLGSLADWVALYRPGQSTPEVAESGVAIPQHPGRVTNPDSADQPDANKGENDPNSWLALPTNPILYLLLIGALALVLWVPVKNPRRRGLTKGKQS